MSQPKVAPFILDFLQSRKEATSAAITEGLIQEGTARSVNSALSTLYKTFKVNRRYDPEQSCYLYSLNKAE